MGNSLANRPLNPEEADRTVALLRAGGSVVEGGRAGWGYTGQNGELFRDEWEDHESYRYSAAEQRVRDDIAKHPAPFRRLLLEEPWAAFSQAFLEGDRAKARELLRATLRHSDEHFLVLDTFLAWPDENPREEDLPFLAKSLLLEAREALRAAVGSKTFDRDRTTYLRGVAFIDTIHEIAGRPGGHHHSRARFHEWGRYYREAIEDCENAARDPICMQHDKWPYTTTDVEELRRRVEKERKEK